MLTAPSQRALGFYVVFAGVVATGLFVWVSFFVEHFNPVGTTFDSVWEFKRLEERFWTQNLCIIYHIQYQATLLAFIRNDLITLSRFKPLELKGSL